MTTRPVVTAFLVGNQRSGTTLLGTLLGQSPRWFYAGELHNLWTRALPRPEARCSCQRALRECPCWTAILGRIGADAGEVRRWQDRAVVRGTWRPRRASSSDPVVGRYLDTMGTLYRAIADEADVDVVIDSSKSPSYAAVVSGAPGVRAVFVHVVRDPRGIVHSRARGWRSEGAAGPRRELAAVRLARVLGAWVRANRAAEILVRGSEHPSIRVRYEDLVADPAATLAGVVRLAAGPEAQAATVTDGTVHVGGHHAAAGNPTRFVTGDVTLREDRAWRHALPRWQQRTAYALARPLMRRYGYRP